MAISIHALREEGDNRRRRKKANQKYFYPRPPRGGRRHCLSKSRRRHEFLSTPSARRATDAKFYLDMVFQFLSTPSARRATVVVGSVEMLNTIFLSTPSARRATSSLNASGGGAGHFYPRPPRGGRPNTQGYIAADLDFYPRPPRTKIIL